MAIPTSLQYQAAAALADLKDLDADAHKNLADVYPQDGKVSAIFAHNCVQEAIRVLAEVVKL